MHFSHYFDPELKLPYIRPVLSDTISETVLKTLCEALSPIGASERRRREKLMQEHKKKQVEKTLEAKAKEEEEIKMVVDSELDLDARMKLAKKRKRQERRGLEAVKALAEAKLASQELLVNTDIPEVPEQDLRSILLGVNGITQYLEKVIQRPREDTITSVEEILVFICKEDANPSHLYSHLPTLAFFAGPSILVCPLQTGAENRLSEALGVKRTMAVAVKDKISDERLDELETVADAFLAICDTDEIDAYWLFNMFASNFMLAGEKEMIVCILLLTVLTFQQHGSTLAKLVEKHDASIGTHLRSIGVSIENDFGKWFRILFAGMLSTTSLEGIWDIYIGGAQDILPFVGLSFLLASKKAILGLRSNEDFINFRSKIAKHVNLEAVASTAIDLWEKPILEAMTESPPILNDQFPSTKDLADGALSLGNLQLLETVRVSFPDELRVGQVSVLPECIGRPSTNVFPEIVGGE
ncbi:TBC1 domain member 7 [Phlyctochytrium bullatum]|nr:TBC1 domain member 7 [Phlyctochytrium bullatum]